MGSGSADFGVQWCCTVVFICSTTSDAEHLLRYQDLTLAAGSVDVTSASTSTPGLCTGHAFRGCMCQLSITVLKTCPQTQCPALCGLGNQNGLVRTLVGLR